MHSERAAGPAKPLGGRLFFLAGLAAWVGLSLKQLPYCYHDIHYLLSLEWGFWGPSEWVHPLFVPVLGLYRALLGWFGFTGRMFLPVELMNVGAGVLTLGLLFHAVERLWGSSWVAAAGALLLGFSHGFWEATLRSDPYALAGLSSAAAVAVLALGGPARRRFGLAGLAAGLAAGFHAAGLSLALVGMVAAWRERGGWKPLGWFLGAMALAVALCLGVFVAYHGVAPEYFERLSAAEAFGKIEQMPGTSIYTSRDPVKQAKDLLNSLLLAGGTTILAATALLLVLALAARVFSKRAAEPDDAAWLACANFAAYSLFFLINNSQNGFVYASLLALPLLLGRWATPGLLRWVFVPAACAAAALGSMVELPARPQKDPMRVETRFLDGLLGRGDVMVVPGCPFPETLYERRFDFLAVGDPGALGTVCVAPIHQADTLVERIAETLRQGRRVYFAAGDLGADFNSAAGDVSGAQKLRQVFWTAASGDDASLRVEAILSVRRKLDASFRVHCGIRSPQGWEYCGLRAKPGAKTRPGKRVQPLAAVGLEDLEMLSKALAGEGVSIRARTAAKYLMDWLSESPDDLYAKRDLIELAAEEVDLRGGVEPGDAGRVPAGQRLPQGPPGRSASGLDRVLALVDALAEKRPSDADKLVGRAEFYVESGRKEDAIKTLKRAQALGLSPSGLRRAAWCYQSMDDCASALAIWKKLVAGRRSAAKDLSDKAVCEYRQGNAEVAVLDLKAALAMEPAGLEAYVSLAALYSMQGSYRLSLDVYEKGLAVKDAKGAASLREQLLEGRDLVRKRLSEAPRAGGPKP
ncbi:MAG: tetratricopeptide repeat protein [Elusimicrobia bacterium]|nr:tetratricopeptide repeat protein [Elusimicrobiota bacterium]